MLIISISDSNLLHSSNANPWGMLAPAFVAIILQRYFFKDSKIYYKSYHQNPIWIFNGFLILTIIYGGLIIVGSQTSFSNHIYNFSALLFTLWTLSAILLFSKNKDDQADNFKKAGLQLGDTKLGIIFIFGVIIFLLSQALLNIVFDLGNLKNSREFVYNVPVPEGLYIPALVFVFWPVTVIGIPLSGLAGVFGEEYGWRGFLQSELIKIGKIKGVLAVGLIWGIWHLPIILRGIHSYPSSLTGIILGLIFFIMWGIVLSYAVLKIGSIWIAAFMHGVVNSVYSFINQYIVKASNKIFSFGLGIYGLACLAVIIYFILRDDIWHQNSINYRR